MGSASRSDYPTSPVRIGLPGRLAGWSVVCLLTLGACGEDEGTSTPSPDTTATSDTGPATGAGQGPTAETAASSEGGATSDTPPGDEQADDERYPDVVDATATLDDDGTWTVSATLRSPYDSPERYADAWRVVGGDGSVYGIRDLAHHHANEQPFARSQSGIEIPSEVDEVTVEGRDQLNGWGGATVNVTLDRS